MELEGEIKNLPYELRKKIYDEIVKIDLDEHDAFVKEGKAKGEDVVGATYETDVPGLIFMIGHDNIVIFITTLIKDTGEKKVMVVKIPRGEEHKLIEDKP